MTTGMCAVRVHEQCTCSRACIGFAGLAIATARGERHVGGGTGTVVLLAETEGGPGPGLCATRLGGAPELPSARGRLRCGGRVGSEADELPLFGRQVVSDSKEGRALVSVGKGDFRVSRIASTGELGVLEVRA